MDVYITLINHLVPVLLTLVVVTVAVVLVASAPYLKYVLYVSEADTPKGREDFARYLAKKTGGRKINVDDNWPAFIKAAKDLHTSHVNNRENIS